MSKRKPKKRAKVWKPPKLTKKQKEALRRKRISESLREYRRTGKTKKERLKKATSFPKLPKGFDRVDPRDEIKTMLRVAGEAMQSAHGSEYKVMHAVNADDSVVYELRMTTDRKFDGQQFLTDLANAMRPVPGAWATVGFRFQPKRITQEMLKEYDRYKGSLQVTAYTQRATSRKMVTLVSAAEMIAENMKAKRKLNPSQCFVQLTWSPQGERPPKSKKALANQIKRQERELKRAQEKLKALHRKATRKR